MAKLSKTVRSSAKTGKRLAGTKVLGVTKDGVRILKPKGKPTHFTQGELRSAVATARTAARAR
jgi:hypothetical protein